MDDFKGLSEADMKTIVDGAQRWLDPDDINIDDAPPERTELPEAPEQP